MDEQQPGFCVTTAHLLQKLKRLWFLRHTAHPDETTKPQQSCMQSLDTLLSPAQQTDHAL